MFGVFPCIQAPACDRVPSFVLRFADIFRDEFGSRYAQDCRIWRGVQDYPTMPIGDNLRPIVGRDGVGARVRVAEELPDGCFVPRRNLFVASGENASGGVASAVASVQGGLVVVSSLVARFSP